MLQQVHRVRDLVVRVHDQHGIEGVGWEARIRRLAVHIQHVAEAFTQDAAPDRREHLRLDVFRVDLAVGPDAPGQTHREPAASRAHVGHDRAVPDAQRVHDQVGLLPRVAVRSFELS